MLKRHLILVLASLGLVEAFTHGRLAWHPVTRNGVASRPSNTNALCAGALFTDLLPLHEAPHLAAALAERQIITATPIQEAAVGFVHKGTSLTLHSETGSGKTLALLAPLLLRLQGRAVRDNRRVLVLAPSRELAAQLASEAKKLLGPDEGSVKLVCLGEKYVPTVESLEGAAVLVATPAELAAALWDDKELREWLPTKLGALVLDEVDALIPSRKFTGQRILYMDEGMHPAEGIVKLVARRCEGPDFQVLAASATLDQATQRKLTRLLRASPALRQSSVFPLPICRPGSSSLSSDGKSTAASSSHAISSSSSDAGNGASVGTASEGSRSTLVPTGIKHYTVSMDKSQTTVDPLKLLRAAAKKLLATSPSSSAAAAAPGIGLVVLCSSLPLKVRVVSRELSLLGFECVGLSDALWPESTRSLKGKSRAFKAKAPRKEGEDSDTDDDDSEADDDELVTLDRREALCSSLAASSSSSSSEPSTDTSPPPISKAPLMKLVVTDQARVRGLHLDDVSTVFVLGGAANADTYLHLAGRTGRMRPRTERAGEGTVSAAVDSRDLLSACVTIAPPTEVKRVRAWAAELGGVEFKTLALGKNEEK